MENQNNNGGNGNKQYWERLKEIILRLGEWNANLEQLSKDWHLSQKVLQKWKRDILVEIGPLDLDAFGRNVQLVGISNLKTCQILIQKAESVRDKCLAIRTMNETIKAFTEFLESYGYKEVHVQKIEIQHPYQEELAQLRQLMAEEKTITVEIAPRANGQ